jgi:hypothetical protein
MHDGRRIPLPAEYQRLQGAGQIKLNFPQRISGVAADM